MILPRNLSNETQIIINDDPFIDKRPNNVNTFCISHHIGDDEPL